jgi:signal peptidase I
MIFEAILILAIIATGFVVCLDKILYPRHRRLFRGKPKLVVLSQSLLPVLAVILLIRSFTFEGFSIPSGSMKPTLVEGDLVVVDKYSFGLRVPLLGYRMTPGSPKRGDIVVFRGEVDGEKAGIIKRIVGLPGDHIQYLNRTLYINGTPATQYDLAMDVDHAPDGGQQKVLRATEKLDDKKHPIFLALYDNNEQYAFHDLVVPKNSYFVLGDYRSNSFDSRYWGVLSDKKLVGKARMILFSVDWANKDVRWKRIGTIS